MKFAVDEVKKESESEEEESEEKEDYQEDGEHKDKKDSKPKKTAAGKLVINEDYVKQRVKKQFWNNEKKSTARRNKNKDKKTMKAQETIKDYFVE